MNKTRSSSLAQGWIQSAGSRSITHTCTQKTQQTMWPWPLTDDLEFNRILEVNEVHVRAKFHQAKCSGSWVIVDTEKNQTKTILSVATADSYNRHDSRLDFKRVDDETVSGLLDLLIAHLPQPPSLRSLRPWYAVAVTSVGMNLKVYILQGSVATHLIFNDHSFENVPENVPVKKNLKINQ